MNLETAEFTPISLDRQKEYLEHFAQCPQKVSDYSFINLWGWAEEYGLEWFFGPTHVWIRQTKPEIIHWAPVGPWDKLDWKECKVIRPLYTFTRVPEELVEIWQDQLGDIVEADEARSHWDYVYSVEELSTLKGNRFHKKKNLLNQFKKKYDFVFHPMSPDCVEDVLQMQLDWFNWRDAESQQILAAENNSIARVLKAWDSLEGVFGGVIEVDGHKAAYTVGEHLCDETLVIHFEKGHTNYKGIYQSINQMFLDHEAGGYKFVNREQDLGDPGLRKAKESYHPVKYQKKFNVKVR